MAGVRTPPQLRRPHAVEKVKDPPRGPKFTFMHEGVEHDFLPENNWSHITANNATLQDPQNSSSANNEN